MPKKTVALTLVPSKPWMRPVIAAIHLFSPTFHWCLSPMLSPVRHFEWKEQRVKSWCSLFTCAMVVQNRHSNGKHLQL